MKDLSLQLMIRSLRGNEETSFCTKLGHYTRFQSSLVCFLLFETRHERPLVGKKATHYILRDVFEFHPKTHKIQACNYVVFSNWNNS